MSVFFLFSVVEYIKRRFDWTFIYPHPPSLKQKKQRHQKEPRKKSLEFEWNKSFGYENVFFCRLVWKLHVERAEKKHKNHFCRWCNWIVARKRETVTRVWHQWHTKCTKTHTEHPSSFYPSTTTPNHPNMQIKETQKKNCTDCRLTNRNIYRRTSTWKNTEKLTFFLPICTIPNPRTLHKLIRCNNKFSKILFSIFSFFVSLDVKDE